MLRKGKQQIEEFNNEEFYNIDELIGRGNRENLQIDTKAIEALEETSRFISSHQNHITLRQPKIRATKKQNAEKILSDIISNLGLKNTTPLSYAVKNNLHHHVDTLLADEAYDDMDSEFKDGWWKGWSFLAYAVYKNHENIVHNLLINGAEANQIIKFGPWGNWTLLSYAVYHDQLECFKALLLHGAEAELKFINGKWEGWSLLAYAVLENKTELIKCLLISGAKADQVIESGQWKNWSLLAYAVYHHQVKTVECLLENNEEAMLQVNQQFVRGGWQDWSFLAYAVFSHKKELVRCLLKHGADADQLFPSGSWGEWSLVAYAVFHNQTEIAQCLLDHNANPKESFRNGRWQGCEISQFNVQKKLGLFIPANRKENEIEIEESKDEPPTEDHGFFLINSSTTRR